MQPVGATVFIAELHFERIGRQHLDDSSDLTGNESQLGHVAYERHGIQELNRSKGAHKTVLIG
jgi:hypothetical protein